MRPITNFTKVLTLLMIVALSFFLGSVLSEFVPMVNPVWLMLSILFAYIFLVRTPSGVAGDLTITDTAYAGEWLDAWITKMVFGFETLTKGCIMIQGGIKKSAHVGVLDVSAFIQADQDPPKFGGTISVNKRSFNTKPFMGYLEYQPRNFEAHWLATQLEPKLLDATLPATFESAVAQKIISLNEGYLDKAIWQSVLDPAAVATAISAGLGPSDNNLIFFDGLLKKMYLDAAVQKVGSPVTLTAGNIVSKFDAFKALVLAQPNGAKIWYDPNFKILVGYTTASLYGDAQKAQTNKGKDFTSEGEYIYDGRPVIPIGGLPANTLVGGVATRDMNSMFWLGVNEVDEETYFRIGKLQANSEKGFVKMLYKIDPQYAISEQVFLYTTLTYS